MALTPGTRFGSYEVVEPVGSGGMGEVWRATDTELKRDVAVKVLPASFAADADRLARFRREAEILASLNHPNIATIHGLETVDDQIVIVMELVDGPTLADRITRGPIPVDEAMGIALQIVAALEAAHDKGIVHRDLKPANVKVREDGTVKVLDFGISKPIDPKATGSSTRVMTTLGVTQTGVILGTAAYMSPEQARGKFVDQRTDIWAFGCVLFEMLTGQPAFGGEDAMLTLARVLANDTNLDSIPATISPAVRQTIKLCLEKDPRKRIHHIGDVRLALAGDFESELPHYAGPAEATASRRLLPMAAGAVLLALVVGATVWALKPIPPAAPAIVTRFDYDLPAGVQLRNAVTSVLDIAPNGEFFVINGSDGMYLRRMGEIGERVIQGVGGNVTDVVVSPDGRDIAFFDAAVGASLRLTRIAIGGGAPIVLADELDTPFGISWESDGTILFGQPDGIWRVSENGGTAERIVTTEDPEQVYGPELLPGGEWLLYTLARSTTNERWNEADIVVESLATGERRVLRQGGFDARYLPTGHLTYVFDNVLFASAFDAGTLALDDDRVALQQDVRTAALPAAVGGSAYYAIADNGTLIFIPGTNASQVSIEDKSLVWVDRQGNAEPLPVPLNDYRTARISPDGTKVALVVGARLPPTDPLPDIYIYDLETENLTQLTFDTEGDDGPVWSQDGSQIYFRSWRDGENGAVYAMPAEGGTPELMARSASGEFLLPWSLAPDGETLIVVTAVTTADLDISTVKVGTDEEPELLIDNDTWINEPMLSPDGEWMVHFTTDDMINAAAGQIDIRPFPNVNQQRRPVARGVHPIFSRDGSEIFFFDGDGLSAVPVQYAPFRVGEAESLFRRTYWYGSAGTTGLGGRAWDIDPNSGRFLMITIPGLEVGTGEPITIQISVVLNWFEELRERVPTD